MTESERRIIEHATAQLRHAYAQIVGGHVGNVRKFADGLIAPQIARLEAVIALQDDEPTQARTSRALRRQ